MKRVLGGNEGTVFAWTDILWEDNSGGKTSWSRGVGIIPRTVRGICNYIYSRDEKLEFYIGAYFEIFWVR